MKKKAISVLLITMFLILSILPIVFAKSANEKKKDLQNQINSQGEEKKKVTNEKRSLLEEIEQLNNKINEYEIQIDKLNSNIKNLKKSIVTKEIEIKRLEKDYQEKEEAFVERMVAIYEAGQTTYLDILLSSDSIVNFISNYYMVSELAEADNTMLNSIKEQREKIETVKKELEDKKKAVTDSRNEVESKINMLNDIKNSKKVKINSLSEKEKKLQKEIEQYQSDLQKVEQQIKEYEEKQNFKENENNSLSNIHYSGGKLGWPVEGHYSITSYYGYRIHPIYGYKKLHTGIDIGAPKNTNFLAAEDGVIISASYSGGYGNRVIISHGNGLSTLYAHGTKIFVKPGQIVKKGQVVLTTGSSGLSTGPHAHFEVRLNGNCVNPLDYLK